MNRIKREILYWIFVNFFDSKFWKLRKDVLRSWGSVNLRIKKKEWLGLNWNLKK